MTTGRPLLLALAWGAALVLPACAQGPGLPGFSQEPQATCNASALQSLVGQRPTASMAERARTQSGALMVRIIGHDEMVTKEFNSSRLNLHLDEQGRIARVYCG